MLVLSRKPMESITLTFGDLTLATLTVCAMQGKNVRIGIHADAMIRVHRTELLETSKEKEPSGLIKAASL